MGTTQRVGNGVKNEPNWGNLSTSVTSLAKTIEELGKLDAEESETVDNTKDGEDEITHNSKNDAKYITLEKRKAGHVIASLNRLVKIGGGSKNISSGKSNKLGRAGLKTSSKLVSFFASVKSSGIEAALKEIGFGTLQGKSTKDVFDFLTIYCSEVSVGMDEVAARSALCEVFKELTEKANDDIEDLEKLMNSYVDSNQLADILCIFFGKYIYEYLWEI